MVFRCSRLGYLFIKRNAKTALGIYGGAFLLPSLALFLLFGMDALKIWIFFPTFFLLATVLTLFSVIYMPGWLFFDNKQLIWQERLNVRHDEITQYTGKYLWVHAVKATVTAENLHSIEFLQTPIERLFNIGRIRFSGDIRSLETSRPVDRPSVPFCYGGIRKFDRLKSYFRENLPDSAFKKTGD